MKEPYKGLRPYEEADQDNFFGREVEKQILVDKILTNKLTLLFAASGVGKSSLLQAAVMPELKRPDRENLTVIYYNDWVEDPRVTLRNTLFESLTATQPLSAGNSLAEITTLPEFLHVATLFIPNQPLVIILDQFEEFFNYQRYSQYFRPFIQQLTQAILDYRTATVFVIAMREDFALELNAFKPELPTLLFENFYRLERLTIDNAKQAIVTPLARFGFRYEDGLLETLIKDLSQREQLDRFGKVAEVVDLHLVVEPPNLQIVCMQLWEIEKNNPHHQITRTVYENQGGAKGLSKNYFHQQIKNFAAAEKKLASAAFNYLVNKHGTKMAHPVGDLAKLLRVDEAALTQTLDKLEQARVLRRQIRLNTTDQGERRILWYELYHDIFSKIIYDWNESYKNRQRLFRLALGVIFVASTAGAIVLDYDFWINRTSYHVRLSLKSGISDTIELYQGQAKGYFQATSLFIRNRLHASGYRSG